MELIALLLLAPFIWTSNLQSVDGPGAEASMGNSVITVVSQTSARPMVESHPGKFIIRPPVDSRLSMTVLEHPRGLERGPASVSNSKSIEVIVSAP